MIPAYSGRARTVSRRGIALAILATVSLPIRDASAQLGGLVKKARDKAVENQVEKRTGTSSSSAAVPKFDEVTLELTTERVAQMIRGLSAGRALLDGRASHVTRRDAAAQKSADLHDKNNKLISDYTDKRYENERCRNDAMNASREKRSAVADKEMKEWQSRAMSDPAFREKAVAIAQKMGEAQARGDTVAFRKLATEMGLKADDPKPDTLAADKACGRELPRPVVLVQIDSLDGIAQKLTDEIRKMEEKAAATEVKESGLNERQFLMARERIEAYLSAVKYKAQPSGFSPAEHSALGAQRGELEKVM